MSTTVEQAAAWFAERAKNTPMPGAKAMFEIAAAALREKAEREDPKPLTFEEALTATDPIWIKDLRPEADPRLTGWGEIGTYYATGDKVCRGFMAVDDYEHLLRSEYGVTWIAYRHKPKEVTK